MKAHFQRAIWPITATAAFFGLALIEYPLGKPRRLLSLVYVTVALGMQIGMYITRIMWLTPKRTALVKSDVEFMMSCCTIVVLASICLTHWHGKRYQKCMKQFNEVDVTLSNLGIETDYSKLRRAGLVGLVTWVIVCIILNSYNCLRYARGFPHQRSTLLAFFMLTPLHARMLVFVQFWLVLGYAGMKFDCISSALEKLTIEDTDYASWFRNRKMISVERLFVPDERARRIVWTVMHVHFQLCGMLRDINTSFESHMSLHLGYDYIVLLYQIILTFRLILFPFNGSKVLAGAIILLWMVPYLVDIILTNHLCETTGVKARTVCNMAVQLLRFMDDEQLRQDVSLIVLQTKLRPIRFSCLGLYYFGYHFMHKIFSTMATTAVIILQLKAGLEV